MSALHNKVFLTQSVFFAFTDRAHPKHSMAEAYFRLFAEQQYYVFTDFGCMMACYNQLRRHMSVTIAKEFLRAMLWGDIELIHSSEIEEKEALKLLAGITDGNYPYQNALVSVLAYRRNVPNIATFDPYQPFFGQSVFALPY